MNKCHVAKGSSCIACECTDPVVKAIIGESEAVLHLPMGEHLAQLLHQTRHSLPLLACLDAALQLAVGIPTLPLQACTVKPCAHIAKQC
jgi:hypothetical protein